MYNLLFTPGKIGTLTIPNRIAMTAASASLSQPDGTMTEEMLAYYEARAKGGVGLIITEMVCVDEDRGVLFPRELNAAREENIPSFRRLADRVHPYGTKIFAQLFHPGANADPKLNPCLPLVSASAATGKKRGQAVEASREDIADIVQKFGQAARRIQESGFDGVEVHAAHHYFLHSFLSPVTNHRQDEYGGSLENRTRILREIVEAIRAACGRDFPLMFRISIEEYIGPKGYHGDTGIKICQLLEGWGVDAINTTASGTDSKLSQSVEPMYYPQGWRKHLAKAVKGVVSIPVLSVALIRDPAYAEKLLEDGVLDFAASVRAHLADPQWAEKARTGREEDILPCISCMACFAKYDSEGHITCAVNPETGYEAHLPPLPQDGSGRLVVVLGAGPAGLEGAWMAARRGFRVILFEKADQAGGQLRLAALAPRKEKILWLLDSLLHRCRQAGVDLRLGHAPTLDELAALAPYAILDATGSKPARPAGIPGALDSPLVCTPPEVLTEAVDIREESVVVVGSGMTGLETAEVLSDRSRNNAVLVLEAAPRLAPGVQGSNRNAVTAVLEVNNVVLLTGRTLTRIGEDRVWFADSQTGEEYVYPCDRVVLALGTVPSRPYGDQLAGLCDRVVSIGDAVTGGQIWDAVHQGYHAARAL
ncbi:MAG TPA: FAD-dependent oxidoreductase [Candidatus Evtepia faecigallinarum]|nr:FAD-dependent oxidoreductase [Candidatus Evtepia faecigallinarum]